MCSVLFLCEVQPIFSDKLRLKSGEVLQGKAVTVTSTHVEWQDLGKKYKFQHSEILGIDIGYDGLPACIDLSTFGKEDCDVLVHKLSRGTVQITKKSSPLKLETFALSKVKYLKIDNDPELELSRYFEGGIRGNWNFSGESEELLLIKTEIGKFSFESKENKNIVYESPNFVRFEIDKRSKITKTIVEETPKVIPGYSPILEKNYVKASFLLGGALLSGAGMVYEYNMSVNAINNNTQYLPTGDGRVFLFSNTFGNDAYDFHRQRFYAYTAALSLIIGYTLYDSFYLGSTESKSTQSKPIYLRPIFDSRRDSFLAKPQNIESANLFYGLSFETQF